LRGRVFADLWPAVDDPATVAKHFREAQSLAPRGVKVTMEEGAVFSIWPLFDDTELSKIWTEAHKAGAPIYVHSLTNDAHRAALRLRPHALVHTGLWHEEIDPDVVRGLKEIEAYVITTIALSRLLSWGWDPEFADDPWIRQRVPILQWETATHPAAPDRISDVLAPANAPWWLPNFIARALVPLFTPDAESGREEAASSGRAAKALHDAGVPLVLGADGGNWPLFTTYFHGVSSQIELEELERAGIPRDALIVAATSRAAEMLGVSSQIGTIEVGKVADLIVVDKNPVEHGMAALRGLRWTIKAGRAQSPEAWLVDPPNE